MLAKPGSDPIEEVTGQVGPPPFARAGVLVEGPEPLPFLRADVGTAQGVQSAYDQAMAAFGQVDIAINNAGTSATGPFEKLTDEVMQADLDLKLFAAIRMNRLVWAQMKERRWGRIINVLNIGAKAPRPNSAAYTATKHAVEGLTKTASLDGRKYDIAVGQIDVGNAMTELAARMAKGVPQANGELAIEPLIDVKIVGQSVLYMANLPLEANVLFHTVMATKMPFVGRG